MTTAISAAATVRESLSRARAEGVAFPEAWESATSDLPYEWQRALGATRSAWYYAYTGKPTTCGAFGVLSSTRG
jgi:hypothetical protein